MFERCFFSILHEKLNFVMGRTRLPKFLSQCLVFKYKIHQSKWSDSWTGKLIMRIHVFKPSYNSKRPDVSCLQISWKKWLIFILWQSQNPEIQLGFPKQLDHLGWLLQTVSTRTLLLWEKATPVCFWNMKSDLGHKLQLLKSTLPLLLLWDGNVKRRILNNFSWRLPKGRCWQHTAAGLASNKAEFPGETKCCIKCSKGKELQKEWDFWSGRLMALE